jgi:hypothetical protein
VKEKGQRHQYDSFSVRIHAQINIPATKVVSQINSMFRWLTPGVANTIMQI